jgi:hypothetical protein
MKGKITTSLDARGYAIAESVITPSERRSLAGAYDAEENFRSRIVIARHGFGRYRHTQRRR